MHVKKRVKSLVVVVAIVIIGFVLTAWIIDIITPRSIMPDFYGTSEEITLSQFIEYTEECGASVYLPSQLPNNLELTAIYFKEGFIAIVVYSAEGNKDYKTAELAIEICGSEAKTLEQVESMIRNPLFETAREINRWPVLINQITYSNLEEFQQKYGYYTLSGRVWIDGYRYIIVAPTLTTDELIQLIGNMELIAT